MTGVPYAATDKDRPEGSLSEQTGGAVARKPWNRERVAVHFADFAVANDIDLLANEGGQGEDLSEVAGPAGKVLVAQKLIQPIRAQPAHASQEKLGDSGALVAECGAALRNNED